MPIIIKAILVVILAIFILFIIPFTVYLALTQTNLPNYAKEIFPHSQAQ